MRRTSIYIILGLCLVLVFVLFVKANPGNVLTNPSFTGGITDWTVVCVDPVADCSLAYDGTYCQDSAGSLKGATAAGKKVVMQGYAWQSVGTAIKSYDAVKLQLQYHKRAEISTASGINIIKAEIAKPSAPDTWVEIWSESTLPDVDGAPDGCPGTGWTDIGAIDKTSYFDESGTYKIRYYFDLKSGNSASAVAYAWFDNANLDVTTPTFNQAAYRWFNNLDSTDVGTVLAAQDTAATAPAQLTPFRLRTLVDIGTADLAATVASFSLQFSVKSGDCDTGFVGESYSDVSDISGTIRFYNNTTPVDGDTATLNTNDPTYLGHTKVMERYEEVNPTNNVAAIPNGQYGLWDFALVDNSATAGTSYCFRMVWPSGSTLNTYTQIPEITTATAEDTITLTIDAGSSINFGTINPATQRATDTTRIKVDTDSTDGYQVSIGRDRSSPAHTLASSANPSTYYVNDTEGGINVFDGLGTCNAPAVWPGSAGVSSGLGFVLWAADINKSTSCWGTGTTEAHTSNEYAALEASSSANTFLNAGSNSPNPSYASIGWSLEVKQLQANTSYIGDVIIKATTNPI